MAFETRPPQEIGMTSDSGGKGGREHPSRSLALSGVMRLRRACGVLEHGCSPSMRFSKESSIPCGADMAELSRVSLLIHQHITSPHLQS